MRLLLLRLWAPETGHDSTDHQPGVCLSLEIVCFHYVKLAPLWATSQGPSFLACKVKEVVRSEMRDLETGEPHWGGVARTGEWVLFKALD